MKPCLKCFSYVAYWSLITPWSPPHLLMQSSQVTLHPQVLCHTPWVAERLVTMWGEDKILFSPPSFLPAASDVAGSNRLTASAEFRWSLKETERNGKITHNAGAFWQQHCFLLCIITKTLQSRDSQVKNILSVLAHFLFFCLLSSACHLISGILTQTVHSAELLQSWRYVSKPSSHRRATEGSRKFKKILESLGEWSYTMCSCATHFIKASHSTWVTTQRKKKNKTKTELNEALDCTSVQ